YSCWNDDCGSGDGMGCKGNTCIAAETAQQALVDFDPTLVDGTDVCFSPHDCFGDNPEGGANLSVAPTLVNADDCTYAFPSAPGVPPPPAGRLNVRVYYQNYGYAQDSSGAMTPFLRSGGEQEILNEDPDDGFTIVGPGDAGAPSGADGGAASGLRFRLSPGL